MLVGAERNPDALAPDSFSAHAQQEFDFRLESGPWFFRFDMDVQFGSSDTIKPLGGYWSSPPWSEPAPGFKIGPPEWLMVQYSLGQFRIRGGVVTEMIGLEDWDPWINYFPTRSLNYNVTPGRTIGAEVAFITEGGYEFFAFGGCDVDWADCFADHDFDDDGVVDLETWAGMKAGVGLTTIQERFSTWSGLTAYPNLNYYGLNITGEIYPHEAVTIGVEGAVSMSGVPDAAGSLDYNFAVLGGISLNVLPAEPIHPMFRIHGKYDPDNGALGLFYPAYEGNLPEVVASAGLSFKANDYFKATVEGKYQHYSFGDVPGLYAGLVFWTPEPAPYTARFPEEAPAEPAAPAPEPAAPAAP